MPRKSQALTGTPAAAQLCGCGHSRLRHQDRGAGNCAAVTWVQANPNPPRLEVAPRRCDCTVFHLTERNT